jgi:alpha-beta hydrolase superfamily lysophospholipase
MKCLASGFSPMLAALIVLAPPPAFAAGRPVTFASLDGTQLSGEFFEASNRPSFFGRGASEDKPPGVVLVHMLSRTKGDWHGLPDRIRDAGITALAIDLRGHGGSSGSPSDLRAMVQDVRAAAQWLASRANVRPDAIAIVGASLGASLALLAAADTPLVRAVGVVSPSLDYRGLRTDVALIKRIGSRPIWLAASTEDPLALRTVRDFAAESSGPREQHLSSVAAHGTQLLDRDGNVGRALVDWLRRSLLS